MSLLCILGSFLKVNVQNVNIFAWQKFQLFFGVVDIPHIFWRQTVDQVDISSFRPTIRLFADLPSIGLFFILRGKHMANYDIHIMESLQGFWETGEMTFIPR